MTRTSIVTILHCSYLVIPQFLSPEETNALLTRSKQLLDEFDIDDHPMTKFTTNDKNHVGDDYFLTSGDKIRYFLEEDAVGENGTLTREKQKAVNKIGHGKHCGYHILARPGSPKTQLSYHVRYAIHSSARARPCISKGHIGE